MSSGEFVDPYEYNPPEIVVPVLWQDEDEQFLVTSRELWDTDDYGVSAAKYVRAEEGYVGISMWSDGTVNLVAVPETLQGVEVAGAPFIPLWEDGQLQEHSGYALSDEAMLERARVFWDHRHTPFTLNTSFDDSNHGRMINLNTGVMSRGRLADYANHRRYDQHALHGTLGKMLDTICVTAGVTKKNAIKVSQRSITAEFIEIDELTRMFVASGLGKSSLISIQAKMRTAIDNQLASGKPYEHGEIILEGQCSGLTYIYDDIKYERIATSSLAALAQSYTGRSRRTLAAQFLASWFA